MMTHCLKCGSIDEVRTARTFKNGTLHNEIRCAACGAWKGYLARTFSVDEAGDYLMPFGKHKGQAIRDLPKDYLDWLCERDDKSPPFRAARTFLKIDYI